MYTASYIVAASQLFAIAFGAPILQSSPKHARSLVERAAYKVFGGDGTPAQGWPQDSEWVAFEEAFEANKGTMMASCKQFNQENNSPGEIDDIKKAIGEVSGSTGIKAEFLLAILMQESKGCVRAPNTSYGFVNPGLMQSFQGVHSCNPHTMDAPGPVSNPCPYDQIKGMIEDGAGVGIEAGLTQSIAGSKASDVSKYYKATRIYNSGSVDPSGNLGAGIATHCYSSDVANRLIGWTDSDKEGCQEATIGSVQGGAPNTSPAGPDDGSENPTPVDTTTPTTPPAAPTGGETTPTAAKFSGAAANCSKWYSVKSGDSCSSTGADMATLTSLNAGLLADCSNLWLDTAYCIAA